jgi:Flp pilus assembly pilin Flp
MIVFGIKAFWYDLRGAALVEYALLLALIALVCVVGSTFSVHKSSTSLSSLALELKGIQIAL